MPNNPSSHDLPIIEPTATGRRLDRLIAMPNNDSNDLPIVEPTGAPCLHLRSKGMYVYEGPESQPLDDDDNTTYWCFKTLKSFGPDDALVGGRLCRDGSRSCYEPI
jgi:hypothetical protein